MHRAFFINYFSREYYEIYFEFDESYECVITPKRHSFENMRVVSSLKFEKPIKFIFDGSVPEYCEFIVKNRKVLLDGWEEKNGLFPTIIHFKPQFFGVIPEHYILYEYYGKTLNKKYVEKSLLHYKNINQIDPDDCSICIGPNGFELYNKH